MGLFNRKPRGPSREERSAQRAVPGRATIVKAGYAVSSQRTETSAPFDIVLDVVVGAEAPVRREVTWTVYNVALAEVQVGNVLDVTVDPLAPDIVYPPGYPPPQFKPNTVRLEDCRILPSGMWLDQRLRSVAD